MIVATAGHVDHGKTSLVRALSGIDTDRLPDERRRGLTIEPGFAYLHGTDGEVLGFVDVPGHERFIANMLAGVAAVDYVLLVVAADDGVMPQTREHVAILDLLGVDAGCAAITKADRVNPERVREVEVEVAQLLDGTSLAGIGMHEVSVVDARGIDALRARLMSEAAGHRRAASAGRFRLSVDRSFNVVGAGLIVTGAVISGTVEVGDHLLISPAGCRARVRDLRVHGMPARRATAGDRAALNLAGERLTRQLTPRGAWVLDEALHAPTRALDARLRLLREASEPLKHWLPVHVHLGAIHVTGHLALLGTRPIAPGETGFVELVLGTSVGAVAGDRFIVRDQSARHTLGGGVIVNPFAPSRGRTRPQRWAEADALANPDSALAIEALLRIEGQEINFDRFAIGRNIAAGDAARILAAADLRFFQADGARLAIASARWNTLESDVLEALAMNHRQTPDHQGVRERTLATMIASRPSPLLFRAVLGRLIADKRIARTGPWLHLRNHRPALDSGDLATWRRIESLTERDGLRAPSLSALSESLAQDPPQVLKTLRRLEGLGLVVAIATNRFITMQQAVSLARLAEELGSPRHGAREEGLTAMAFREKTGIGRNQAIETLEYFDRVGFTRRTGEHRSLLRTSAEIFGEPLS